MNILEPNVLALGSHSGLFWVIKYALERLGNE